MAYSAKSKSRAIRYAGDYKAIGFDIRLFEHNTKGTMGKYSPQDMPVKMLGCGLSLQSQLEDQSGGKCNLVE